MAEPLVLLPDFMTDAGLFVRDADPHDGRRIFIALAEGAYDALARYFEALEE